MSELIMEIGKMFFAGIGGFVGGKYALHQFKLEQVWEAKKQRYEEIIDALATCERLSLQNAEDENTEWIGTPEQQKSYSDARDRLLHYAALQDHWISKRAAAVCKCRGDLYFIEQHEVPEFAWQESHSVYDKALIALTREHKYDCLLTRWGKVKFWAAERFEAALDRAETQED